MRKFAVVVAAAAGLLALGGPAFADVTYEDHAGPQVGLLNLQGIDILKDINVNAVVGLCGNQILAIPVLSPPITGSCASGAIVD